MNKMPDEIFASIKHKWDDCLTGNWTTIDENTALTSYTRTSILEAERAAHAAKEAAWKEREKVLVDLLEDCQTGLKWYQAEHPEDASDADDELHGRIEAALQSKGE